jgi:hypothetical protein
MLSSGTQSEAARFLTGFPSIDITSNTLSVEEVKARLKNGLSRNYLITSVCYIEWKGLVGGHGYIIKDLVTLTNADGSEINLVKVKNPWKQIGDPLVSGTSRGEWVGKFSSKDHKSWTE